MSVFCTRYRNGSPAEIFEDGKTTRDFIHVEDVVNATCIALQKPGISGELFNIASGAQVTVYTIAQLIKEAFHSELEPVITGEFRLGDVRYMVADVEKAHKRLGFSASVKIEDGIVRLVSWVLDQPIYQDLSRLAMNEIRQNNLGKG